MSDYFENIENFNDLAIKLSVTKKKLFFLCNSSSAYLYKTFFISKKNGGKREIDSPKKSLYFIQKFLKKHFEDYYTPKKYVYGFVKNKNISNCALVHLKKRYILHIDLKDYFHQITCARLIGIFRSSLFKMNNTVSSVIAKLVTINGILPEGSSTSPILANITTYSLDNALFHFCELNGLTYSRYADDITISFDQQVNGKILFANNFSYRSGSVKEDLLSDTFINIFKRNDFIINYDKVYFSSSKSHKEVTGVVVNEKLNIKKEMYYKIRLMLHSIKINGLPIAAQKYSKIVGKSFKYKDKENEYFLNVLKGLLNYTKMVCGEDSYKFNKLARDFCYYTNSFNFVYSLQKNDINNSVLAVIVSGDDSCVLGSCFSYRGYFITCKHCVCIEDRSYLGENIILRRQGSYINSTVLAYSEIDENDICILSNDDKCSYFLSPEYKVKIDDSINIYGFPEFEVKEGYMPFCNSGYIRVMNRIVKDEFEYIVISCPVQLGFSGGPAIINGKVFGMVVYGNKDFEISKVENGILSIDKIDNFINKYEHNSKAKTDHSK